MEDYFLIDWQVIFFDVGLFFFFVFFSKCRLCYQYAKSSIFPPSDDFLLKFDPDTSIINSICVLIFCFELLCNCSYCQCFCLLILYILQLYLLCLIILKQLLSVSCQKIFLYLFILHLNPNFHFLKVAFAILIDEYSLKKKSPEQQTSLMHFPST